MSRSYLGGERRKSVLGRGPAFSKPTEGKRGGGGVRAWAGVRSGRTLGEVVWTVAFIFRMTESMLSKS